MRIDIVFLPRDLQPWHLQSRGVIVFDVLRATTSMAAALAAGVKEIRVFPDTASALSASRSFDGSRLLCGEERCLPPAGFDLGNSPSAFSRDVHAGRTMFMSTTNGTRAIYAAHGAAKIWPGALVNASAVARAAARSGLDLTLLCAGTDNAIAAEDLLGAGGVLDAIVRQASIVSDSDTVFIAQSLFDACRDGLPTALRSARGGKNVIAASLEPDIDFAARLDSLDAVGEVVGDPPVIRPVR